MNFITSTFFVFILLFFIFYYITPKRCRYFVLLVGSYVFYGWGSPEALLILLLTTAITYIGGFAIEKSGRDRRIFALFFTLNIFVLLFFKYTNFAITNLNKLALALNPGWKIIGLQNIMLPVGLSFYIFQSCSYLGDVYRRGIPAERNFFRYAAFVSFFPTILSGPIQKSRELLPQIKAPADFEEERAIKGFILFVWGLFQKIVVANSLAAIVNKVFNNYLSYQPDTPYYIVAAISFSLYIYADFSSYSDMARGISKLLGIEIKRNFNNPYLSTSLSEFWTRWHVTLNEWFIENIYIPLGGNRKGTARKYLNTMIVFLISGLWHGASWHFAVWGVLNGVLSVIGQILRPLKKKFYEMIHVDESTSSIVWIRRVIVFWLITLTWVFFRNDIHTSFIIIRRMIWFSPIRLFTPDILNICGSPVQTLLIIIATVIFCFVQYQRKDERGYYLRFKQQPVLIQCTCLAAVICVCVFVASSASTTLNTEFLYFQF